MVGGHRADKRGFRGRRVRPERRRMTLETTATTRNLAAFASGIRYEDLPQEVSERAKELFLDWVAATLAGKNARPVRALERFAEMMGPPDGPCEILVSRRRTSPLFAALANGGASHVVEQDDVHSGALFHPGAVVFPAALAAAQEAGASGEDFLTAAVVGYETGTRIGRFLGPAHYKVFHTTGTAGTLAAAAAVARLLAAYLAREGFTGATRILEGEQGMAAGMSEGADPNRLIEGLGERWAVLETSFKFHASCRHTHPAADALLNAMREHDLGAGDVTRVRARVHAAAIDVLGPVTDPRTIHQSKFSMGFVLALIARYGRAGVNEFTEEALRDPEIREFAGRVEMVFDREAEADTAET